MADEPPPIPVEVPAAVRPARPPVPGWMWKWFTLGPVVIFALWAVVRALRFAGGLLTAPFEGALSGLIAALPFLAGLALAGRIWTGTTGRIVGGLLFGFLFLVGIVFALILIFIRLNGNRLWQS